MMHDNFMTILGENSQYDDNLISRYFQFVKMTILLHAFKVIILIKSANISVMFIYLISDELGKKIKVI